VECSKDNDDKTETPTMVKMEWILHIRRRQWTQYWNHAIWKCI